MADADLKVVELYPSNYRDPVATLRQIAQEIEDGVYGGVGAAALVLLGDTMEVFAMGEDSEAPSAALLLHAGFARLSNSLEQHGKGSS